MKDKKELTFSDIRKLRTWIEWDRKFEFPWLTGVNLKVKVLSQNQIVMATSVGREKAHEEIKNPTTDEISKYVQREIIFRCCYNESGKVPFFNSPEEAWELTLDEITLLFEYYNSVQEEFWPNKEIDSEETFNKYIEEVKKKSPIGMSLSTHTLRKLLLFLVADSTTSQNDNGFDSIPLTQENEKSKKNTGKVKTELKIQ